MNPVSFAVRDVIVACINERRHFDGSVHQSNIRVDVELSGQMYAQQEGDFVGSIVVLNLCVAGNAGNGYRNGLLGGRNQIHIIAGIEGNGAEGNALHNLHIAGSIGSIHNDHRVFIAGVGKQFYRHSADRDGKRAAGSHVLQSESNGQHFRGILGAADGQVAVLIGVEIDNAQFAGVSLQIIAEFTAGKTAAGGNAGDTQTFRHSYNQVNQLVASFIIPVGQADGRVKGRVFSGFHLGG